MRWAVAVLVCGALASLPAPAEAVRIGSTAMHASTQIGLVLEQLEGELPAFVGDGDRVERTAVWFHLRGGVVKKGPATDFGSQVGLAYAVRLGVTPSDRPSGDVTPVGFAARLEVAYRAHTFQWPAEGMVTFHAGGELGAGGGYWWSDGARWSFLGGFVLAMAASEDAEIELDYTLVPHVLGSTPGELDISRTEHRLSATIRGGALGLGVWSTFFSERTRPGAGVPYVTTTGTLVGIGVEWR